MNDDELRRIARINAPGRADFLRMASAAADDDSAGLMQVIAELSVHHPSAWQLTLLAGVADYVQAVRALNGDDLDRTIAWLNAEAMKAIDAADEVADNPPNLRGTGEDG